MKKRNLYAIIVLLLVLIPLSVFFTLSKQKLIIQKEAAFSNLSLSLNPTSVSLSVGDQIVVDVLANAGLDRVTGVTTDMSINTSHFDIVSIAPAAPNQYLLVKYLTNPADASLQNETFVNGTWLITDTNKIPFTIAYISINDSPLPREQKLPTGNFVLAQVSLKAKANGSGQIVITSATSRATGHNPGSTDVDLAVNSNSVLNYTIGSTTVPTSTPAGPTATPTTAGTPTPTPTPDPVCDMCGYCDGQTGYPENYDSCTQCLYENPGPPPANPKEGYQWTIAGCIEASTSGFVQSVVAVVMPTAGGGSLIVLIIGSMMILTSGGDYEAIKRGRRLIVAGVGSILILLSATAILEFVGVDLIKIPGFGG